MKIKRSLALVLAVLMIMTVSLPAAFGATEVMDRISGSDRFETAALISEEGWEASDVVVLANGNNFPDALAGVPLAHALEAPILLTGAAKLDKFTKAELKRLEATEVYILGGTTAISAAVEAELVAMDIEVTRVSGNGRSETAAAIGAELAKVLDVKKFDTAVVVFSGNYPDALAAASYAAIKGWPVLLTASKSVDAATTKFIKDFDVKNVFVIGGKSVISDDVKDELKAKRIAGDTREETAVALAKHFELETNKYFIATGYNFADAVAGAALAAKEGTGILLVGASLPAAVSKFLKDGKVMETVIFGGTKAVSAAVANNVEKGLFNPYEINVEGVVELTKTVVSVSIHPLAADYEDATIQVIDNKGVVRAVKAVNLVINETEASFEFVTALTANPEGIWTINGFEYDVDTVNILAAVNEATSELALYNALVKYGFENIKVANSPAYYSAFEGDFKTLAEIQKFIDEVNTSLLTDADLADLIEALENALANGSQVLVLNALSPWVRVNSAYIGDYITDLDTAAPDHDAADLEDEFERIQGVIDAKNLAAAGTAVDTAENDATRAKYNLAVTAVGFVAPDEEDDDPMVKKALQERLVELNLVLRVKEATTAAQFANAYNALVNYFDEDDTTIGVEEFYTALRTQYMAMVDDDDVKDASEIELAIVKANTIKRAQLYNTVAGITGTSTKAIVINSLKALAVYADEDDFDYSDVVESRWEAYRTELALLEAIEDVTDFATTASPTAVATKIGLVQDAIDAANASEVAAPLEAVKDFTGTEAELLALLKDAELALGNVIDANSAAYFAETTAIIAAATASDYTNAAFVTAARTALKDLITDLNQVQIIANATTVAEARPALGYVAIEGSDTTYINLTAAQKTEVAGLFINNAKWGSTKFVGAARKVENLKAYTDMADVDADLIVLVAQYNTVLSDINAATAIDVMVTKLGALDYKAYTDLTAAQKIDVADYFIANFPMTTATTPARIDYTTFAAIQAAVDAAIAATK